jgi:hypothetical protein
MNASISLIISWSFIDIPPASQANTFLQFIAILDIEKEFLQKTGVPWTGFANL